MSLTFINEQYLFKGAADGLRGVIGGVIERDKSKELAKRLIDFVQAAEQQLRDGERLPMSTEILESAFGLYKQLEGERFPIVGDIYFMLASAIAEVAVRKNARIV